MPEIGKRLRDDLRERANGCCERCGARANNAHHRINRSQGGPNTLSNLLLLCGSGTTGCHGWVTHNPEDAYQAGWSLKRHHNPESEKVLIRGQWMYLRDDGTVEWTA